MISKTTSIRLIVILSLVTITLLLFHPVKEHSFLNWDDNQYVTENPRVKTGVTGEGIHWAFTSHGYASNWHPLTWISHMLDVELFGMDPGWHHLVNVFFHAANTALLFLLLTGMTGSLVKSALTAALFAVHPLHVESVAWVAERKDVLCAFFWFLTMGAYFWYTRKPNVGRYLVVALNFSLGLMAKPMLVTLPFVLLLLDYWPLERLGKPLEKVTDQDTIGERGWSPGQLVLEKTPLFLLAAASSAVTYLAQMEGGSIGPWDKFTLPVRAANAIMSYLWYLGKMIWPVKLAAFYPHQGVQLPLWQVTTAGLILIVLTLLLTTKSHRYRYLGVGWGWYLVTLLPVIGLVQVGPQAMADRYMYIPSIGLFILIVWGMNDLTGRWSSGRKVSAVAALAALILLTTVAHLQIGYWQNSGTLFKRALEVTSGNWLAHNNLGVFLYGRGKLEEARFHYLEALKIRPEYARAHSNLGVVYRQQKKFDEAVKHYNKARQIDPGDVSPVYNLGLAYEMAGDLSRAEKHYREALILEPDYPQAHNNIGSVMIKQGRYAEAMDHLSEAVSLDPFLEQAHFNVGNILYREGRVEEASDRYREALMINPDYGEAHLSQGNALSSLGKTEKAEAHYREALRINPNHPVAHNNYGTALLKRGKLVDAKDHFMKAVVLEPGYGDAHFNLATVLEAEMRLDEAIHHYKEALKTNPGDTDAKRNLGKIILNR